MLWPQPIGVPQLAVFGAIMAAGAVALFTVSRNRQSRDAACKSGRSVAGIVLQGVGFGTVGFGPTRISLAWNSPSALILAAIVALLGAGALALFVSAATTMGKNWSVVARMRSDHELVRSGPFATVRHPIYLALLLYLLSFALALGHLLNLVIALPFYCAGTTIRIREEEKLLREKFGDEHERYTREVSAFIPGIF